MSDSRVIGAYTFSALERAFASQLRATERGAWNDVWVLTPTNLVAIHLRRIAAQALGGVAGLRFLTLKDAALACARTRVAASGLRPLPSGADSLFLKRLLSSMPASSYFHALGQFRNAAPAMLGAIRLLKTSLWSPSTLQEAAGLAPFRDPSAAGRLREIAAAWHELRRWKGERRWYDGDDLTLLATKPDCEPTERPAKLLLYGFYDFTPAQQTFVARLIDLASTCSAFLLWAEEDGAAAPGFEYATPVVEWLRRCTGGPVERQADEPADDLSRLTRALFADDSVALPKEGRRTLEGPPAGADGTVEVLSCPGECAEAREVAREALRAAARRAGKTGVMLRATRETVSLLTETFDRSGIAYYVREGLPLWQTTAGRIVLALLDLAAEDAERAAVVNFLALARVDWPDLLSATALDRVSRRAGVRRGPEQWRSRLERRAADCQTEAEHADDETEAAALQREADVCAVAGRFVSEFLGRLGAFAGGEPLQSWGGAMQALSGLCRELTPQDASGRQAVLDVLEELGELDAIGASPDAGTLRWLLSARLAGESERRNQFQRVGVTLTSIMAARGVTFDTVIVPRMNERSFPNHEPLPSLVTELDRHALNYVADRVGACELPLLQRRAEEERYLFRLAVGSARKRLVLTYPRMQDHTDRPLLASRFCAASCAALTGLPTAAALLDDGLPQGLVRRIPLSTADAGQDALAHALHPAEYDAIVFATGADGLRTEYLSALSSHFARAATLERERWQSRSYGRYDGKIRNPQLLAALAEQADGRPVSPTQVERYAECPFQYFVQYVLQVREVEEPSREFRLSPLERGSLIHDLLRTLYAEKLQGIALQEVSDSQMEASAQRAAELLDRLGAAHAENQPAVWRVEREEILAEVRELLEHDRSCHPGVPERLEFEFGQKRSFLLENADGHMAFRGRIDRVDRRTDGGIRVIDYKTGSTSRHPPNNLAGGQQVQLPIYLLAAAEILDASHGEALYVFTKKPQDVPEFSLETRTEWLANLRKVLELFSDSVASGDFFMAPAEPPGHYNQCGKYCPCIVACGAARGALAGIKADAPDMARLNALREIE